MCSKARPFMRVVPVLFRKYVFSLRRVEKDHSLVHVVTGSVSEMVINVNMFGKASGQHSLMLLNTSVGFFASFNRESFRYHSFSSGTSSSGDFVTSL